MDLLAAMRTLVTEPLRPGAAGALLALLLAASPAPARAQPDQSAPPAVSGAPSFEVLKVTTGSGSGRHDDKKVMRIEILDLKPKSPAEAAAAARAEAEADPGLTPAQREAKARAAALETALELWHSRTLGEYRHDLARLPDPFMPIREVRGKADSADISDSAETLSLPPILRLELSQLKLVAITVRSNSGAGGALASFEDGTGASYILRPGDRVGRRQGRVTGITANTVTVEEPPSAPGAPSRITEIKLGGRDAGGLTRLGGQVEYDLVNPAAAADRTETEIDFF
jgi:Tfp pilus assembly protein PilP